MPEDDASPAARAVRVAEPRHRARRSRFERPGASDGGAAGVDEAEAGEEAEGLGCGVELGVGRRLVALPARAADEERGGAWAGEERVHGGRALAEGLGGPPRGETGVHDEASVRLEDEGTRGEPAEEVVPVRRGEERAEGLVGLGLGGCAHPAAERVDVVVAEDGRGRRAKADEAAKHTDGVGPAVDQIAGHDEAVPGRVERDAAEEAVEGFEVPLEVTDDVGRHGPSLHPDGGRDDGKRRTTRPEERRVRENPIASGSRWPEVPMPARQTQLRPYPRWRELLSEAPLPAAIVDLDAVDANLDLIASHLGRTSLRPATKSLRIPALLLHIAERLGARLSGWMLFSAAEAALLAERAETQLLDDLLIAYPVGTRHDAARVVALARTGKRVRVVIDAAEHVALLADAAAGAVPPTLSVVLDIDAAWRPLAPLFPARGGPHLGVRRSPVRTADAAIQLARSAEGAGLRVSGLMAYEAQVAGIQDRNAGSRHLDPLRRFVRRASAPDVAARRAAIVKALRGAGFALDVVNGGGSGSLLTTPHDPSVTEVTAGSGVLGPHGFDGYRGLPFSAAAFFALPVTRIPDASHVTCAFGGFIASGAPSGSRAPVVHLPAGLAPLEAEGFGEVQTPLRRDARVAPPLAIGDPIICRHAKAGELFEHFNHVLLVRGDAIVARAPTYRGLGLAAG